MVVRWLGMLALLPLAACAPQAHVARSVAMIPLAAADSWIGEDRAPPDEGPRFRARVGAFLMDRTPVTVAQFGAFVRDTRYVTDAERQGGEVLDRRDGGWVVLHGADWRRPEGPSAPASLPDHPVVQVSWRDADAFCRAYGARLPTELEWERAARLGQTPDGHVFHAGDPVALDGRWRANVWQGLYPLQDDGLDGWKTTSPVGAFGAAPSGLTDMAGNVWEWTSSWYLPYGAEAGASNARERVQRGGSFLCDPSFCQGFRVTARGHSTPDSALMHVGFRCAADGPAPPRRAGHVAPAALVRAAAPPAPTPSRGRSA